jgi:hypothetical protein
VKPTIDSPSPAQHLAQAGAQEAILHQKSPAGRPCIRYPGRANPVENTGGNMPYAIPTTNPTFPKVYNVEQAVGLNAPNATGDVKLVQYMLKGIYGSAAPDLAVDGWIGPKTVSWIKRFQTDAKNGGTNVLIDGRVDRACGQIASVSGTSYTILLMNCALQKQNPAAYYALPQQIQLSTNPKPNPYNPKPRKQIKSTIEIYGKRKKVTIWYDDGTVEVIEVNGQIIIDGKVVV